MAKKKSVPRQSVALSEADEARRITLGLGISPREYQVLVLMAQGQTPVESAATLGITRDTVKVHRHHIFRALGMREVSDAYAYAERLGVPPGKVRETRKSALAKLFEYAAIVNPCDATGVRQLLLLISGVRDFHPEV